MAPEQAKGKPVDRRVDIWAFGIVVLEMLTGKRTCTGETTSEILAAVMMKDPDFSGLPPATPPHVRNLLRRCLTRDPLRRLRDIGKARIALESSPAPEGLAAGPVAMPRRGMPLWASATLAAVAVALSLFFWRALHSSSPPLTRFSVDLGPEAVPNIDFTAIISPDGRRLVYFAHSAGGSPVLATRLLDQSEGTVLPGTENAQQPFFRPDSQWIGFFSDGKLKKISVHGGGALALCEAVNPRGAWWGGDGAIVLTPNLQHLFRVAESGDSPPQPIGKPEDHADRTWRWPQVLPGGQAVLITAGAGTGGYEDANIEVVSIKTAKAKTLLRGGYFGRYLPSGHLVYLHQGTLLAVPFDVGRLETRGAPMPILNDVAGHGGNGAGELDFSQTGTLVYLRERASIDATQIVWLDSGGKTQPLFSPHGAAYNPQLSPDGKRLAFVLNGDIMVHDPQRDSTTRLSFRPDASNHFISWMPDGKHIIFGQGTPKPDYAIWWVRSDGSGQPEKLFSAPEGVVPSSVSPDGRRIAFSRLIPGNAMDIWMLPLDLSDPDHPKAGAPELYLSEPGIQWDATFSPDGRWIAYTSSEAGPNQIFVRPFPAGPSAGKWQISNTAGGSRFPVWSRTGRELFYCSATGRIMVAAYTARGESFAAEKPREWSSTPVQLSGGMPPFDLAPDGRRVVMSPAAANSDGKSTVHVTILLNFFDELKRRMQ
jgi:serine/threonine-protein kinase